MTIDIEEFESADTETLVSGGRPPEPVVLDFLAFNPEQAYTRREIHAEIDTTIFGLASMLSNLEAEGLVRRKGSYWIVTEKGTEVARRESG